MQQNLNDHAYMAEAMRLAQKGLYTTRINPRVGCVIVKQGKIIARGLHAYYGQSHAEIDALSNAIDAVENATAYVTLEPCAHHGNTPPCVEALVAAKISRVVAAITDPNPLVNGKGLAYLKQSGIETSCNVLEKDALELNKGFIKRITKNLPYVTIKSAISIDGKTALASGESKWITSEHARFDVQKLRARSCAILTGISTILCDDPSLTVRLSEQELSISRPVEQPLRVILDTYLRIPKTAKVLNLPGKTVIFTCSNDMKEINVLQNQNIDVVSVNSSDNRVDLQDVLHDLADRGINEVLVEAGSTLVGSMLDQKQVDEMIIYIAPHLLGETSRSLAKLTSVASMQDRIELEFLETKMVGNELRITAKPITN